MFLLRCPWCGPREEHEFRYGGQAHLSYPGSDGDDAAWAKYLYVRDNPAGPFAERWVHSAGCRQWFNVVRDTTTHRITGSYLPNEKPGDAW
jgi:heterotetrameric sarcosine oxidase delta subunit